MDRSNVPIAHCFSPCATKMPKLSTKQMCSWVSHPMSSTQRSTSEAIPPISKSTDATCRCRGKSSTTCPRLPRQTRGQATVCGAFSQLQDAAAAHVRQFVYSRNIRKILAKTKRPEPLYVSQLSHGDYLLYWRPRNDKQEAAWRGPARCIGWTQHTVYLDHNGAYVSAHPSP